MAIQLHQKYIFECKLQNITLQDDRSMRIVLYHFRKKNDIMIYRKEKNNIKRPVCINGLLQKLD